MTYLSVLATVIFIIFAADSLSEGSRDCRTILKNGGASNLFDNLVAHSIHSMSLQDLQMFDPTATEANDVPTINFDLTSDAAILPYAPSRTTNDTGNFLTEGMKVLDLVLSNMDKSKYEISGYSALERIVHRFHMREVWARVKVEFEKLGKSTPAPDADFCNCAMDVEASGIMRALGVLALRYRGPGKAADQEKRDGRETQLNMDPNHRPTDTLHPILRPGLIPEGVKALHPVLRPVLIPPGAQKLRPVLIPEGIKAGNNHPILRPSLFPNLDRPVLRPSLFPAGAEKLRPVLIPPEGAKAGNPYPVLRPVMDPADAEAENPHPVLRPVLIPAGVQTETSPMKPNIVRNEEQFLPALENAAAWEIWKMNAHVPEGLHHDPALFLYCALKKA